MADYDHLSKQTRNRAFILAKNAKDIGLKTGPARFNPASDYLSYWLYRESSYVVLYCTPQGYLVEFYWALGDREELESSYYAIKNIRHMLQTLKRMGYDDIANAFPEVGEKSSDDVDLKDFIEGLED